MSQEAIIRLAKLAQSDEALLGELQAAKTHEEKAAVAVRHGCDVRAEELASLRTLTKVGAEGELSDAELELVAGGGIISWLREHLFASGKDGNKVVGVKGKF